MLATRLDGERNARARTGAAGVDERAQRHGNIVSPLPRNGIVVSLGAILACMADDAHRCDSASENIVRGLNQNGLVRRLNLGVIQWKLVDDPATGVGGRVVFGHFRTLSLM